MTARHAIAAAALYTGLLAAPAQASCVDWGSDLEVCGTSDMDVATNDFGLPVHERTQDQRLTQVFWTAAGNRMQSPDDLEPFFWDVWSAVGNRLDALGTINYGTDYTATVNDRPVRGNIFTLRPETGHVMFFIRLEVSETHGIPVAIEVIEPALGSNTATTNALIAQAMDMIQPQGTGPTSP
jgi:hypothetical protein